MKIELVKAGEVYRATADILPDVEEWNECAEEALLLMIDTLKVMEKI